MVHAAALIIIGIIGAILGFPIFGAFMCGAGWQIILDEVF